jgi:hypothetical protein
MNIVYKRTNTRLSTSKNRILTWLEHPEMAPKSLRPRRVAQVVPVAAPVTEDTEQRSIESAMEEALESGTIQMPPLSELLIQAQDSLASPVEDEDDQPNPSMSVTSKGKRRRLTSDVDMRDDDQQASTTGYAESFASQREVSSLRAELDQTNKSIAELKEQVKLMEKERSQLPHHLSVIKGDLNRDITLVLDRLQAITESAVERPTLNAASTMMEGIRSEITGSLEDVAANLMAPPTRDSPLIAPRRQVVKKFIAPK